MSDYLFIDNIGVIIADTSQTLEEVQDEYKLAFSDAELVVDSGDLSVLINAEAEQRDALARNNAQLANQINPNESGGVFLDSIMSLTGTQRDPGERTTVTATLGGVVGTLIPGGSAASTATGDRFISTGDAIIGGSGTVDIQFQSDVFGPVALSAGELNQILDSVLGWETITNASSGVIGRFEQSDESAINFRRATLAIQSISLSEAVFSNLRAVDNVSSLSYRENEKDFPQVIDGISLPPNSIYVCVSGGTDDDVAATLLRTKTGGAQWHNNESDQPVTINTTDPISGQDYEVLFDRPTDVPVELVYVVSSKSSIADTNRDVKAAALAYANGLIAGEDGLIVGGDASPFEFAGAITVTHPEILVRSVSISTVADGNPQPQTISVALFEKASLSLSDIIVTIV